MRRAGALLKRASFHFYFLFFSSLFFSSPVLECSLKLPASANSAQTKEGHVHIYPANVEDLERKRPVLRRPTLMTWHKPVLGILPLCRMLITKKVSADLLILSVGTVVDVQA